MHGLAVTAAVQGTRPYLFCFRPSCLTNWCPNTLHNLVSYFPDANITSKGFFSTMPAPMISTSTVHDQDGKPHTIRTLREKRRAEGFVYDGQLCVIECPLMDPPRTPDGERYVPHPATTDAAAPLRLLRVRDATYLEMFEVADDYVVPNAEHSAFPEPLRSYVKMATKHAALPKHVVTTERQRTMTKERWLYQGLDYAKVPLLSPDQSDQLLRAAYTANAAHDPVQREAGQDVMRYYHNAGWTVETIRPYRRRR